MEIDINKLVRGNVLKLKPYSSARDEFEGEASVFLDANENPYPTDYNRYPDPHQKLLKNRIGELKKVNASQIFLGNGSDEAIDLLFRAFCEPGKDEVLIPQPTYGMYAVSASINDVKINSVSLTKNFDLDVATTLAAVTPQTKIIFLCSPNNPSGNLLTREKVIEVIKNFKGLVVVDEAYIDFTNSLSFTELLDQNKNLVILQTLSKAWGLAGLRLGISFASVEIISLLNKIKPPYNISSITQSLALKRLQNVKDKDQQVKEVVNQRKLIEAKLLESKIVEHVYPSDSNFLLVKVKNAKNVYDNLLSKGIVLRDRSNVILCDDCLRITIGTPKENQILLDELKKL
ncbi:MAG TPA: histidinol-phosphate transaminase [Cyclobacteriaceae bacterium]|jgi:histidinol-phosphate aminotransferase|nr:histidinol-phosphate transaminase [Cyclobacteriaceae bacterium]